jgi:hypothetical protein
MKLGNAGGAKAPCSDADVQSGKSPGTGASLSAPLDSVRTLQTTLRAKAKSEAAARFYSLWDKVYRENVLLEAYRRCRANRGALGVGGESFEDIEADGLATWLQRLRQELRTKQYRCAPLLRVWIPKASEAEGSYPRRDDAPMNYFSQGSVGRIDRDIDTCTARPLRVWLRRRSGKRGTGYRQYSDQSLYEKLGLIRLVPSARDRSNAKA